jgi:asparagine synthase (glutamine-hydrolysing)
MSGIVALLDRGGTGVGRENLDAMLDSIEHRGPDGKGAWLDEGIALGHQQLQSTPESRFDDQPYRDDELVVVADARLDNRAELLDRLDFGDDTREIPDSHLLTSAYRKWGQHCVDNLVGAFAFVIWDEDAQTVYCARDHMGVKPLYWYRDENFFAIASEVKALLTQPFVPKQLDEVKVGDFFVGRFGDKTNTYYQNVRRLAPAHAMAVGAESSETWQYWDLDPSRTIELESDAAYERRFRELFEQAVECRLRTPDPVGTTFSGGMDSSSVAVVARDVLPSEVPLHTFSWVFDEAPNSDEREYIESLTDRDGIVPHYLHLDDIGVLVDSEEVFGYLDEPPFNSMHYGWWEQSKLAAETDVGVLLDGALGDSATSYGFGLLPELLRTGNIGRLYTEIQDLADSWNSSKYQLFKQKALAPLVPDPLKRKRRELRDEAVLESKRAPALDPAFSEEIGLRSRHKRLYEDRSLFGETARQQQYTSIMMGLTTANLETINARHSRFGLEPRHPFTDKRLLEFSLAIPASQQLSDGYTRSIIRRSLSDLLPKKIRERKWKTSVTEGFWLALSSDIDRVEDVLSAPGYLDRCLDMRKVQAAYDDFQLNEDRDSHDARTLWKALSLWLWLQHHEFDST